MKKWFIHILLLAGLFGMLTTSCSQDEVVEQSGTTNGTVRIQFTLDMDQNSGSRAANWSDITGDDEADEEDIRKVGSIYENTINLGQLQVFLFQGNQYLGEVGGLSWDDNGSGTNKNTYTFRGEVTVHNATITSNTLTDATIMVVANYDGYVDGNRAITQNYIFDYIAGAYNASASNKKYIPMWGMLKPEGGIPLYESADDDTFTPIGNIYMLRSLAKIEVVMGDGIDPGYTFTSATLGKYNKKAYLLPAVPSGSTYLSQTSTSEFHTENCKNPMSSSDNTPLAFEVANGGRSCVLYVPEYSSSSKDLNINLQISNNDTPISDNLENGGTFTLKWTDLVRNHWYKCTVNQINDGANIDVTCQVQPWELQQQAIDYTSEPAAAEGGKIHWIGANPDASNQVTLNSSLEAQCTFTLNSPLGYQWVASLVPVGDGASAANSPFRFVTNGQVAGMDTSGIIDGKPVTLTIKSTATDGVDEDKAVQLQIIVIKGDGTSVILDEDVIGGPYTVIHTK